MCLDNVNINKYKNIIDVELEYPRSNNINTVEISLCDVKTTDKIRVKYDLDRNGWVIYQPRGCHFELEDGAYGYKEEWVESVFCST